MTEVPSGPDSRTPRSRRRSGRRPVALAGVTALAALLALAVVRAFVVQAFVVPTASMEPLLRPGDRIVVSRLGASTGVSRGDVVVFDGSRVFAGRGDDQGTPDGIVGTVLGAVASLLSVDTRETDFVKRVIGLPGDQVKCCDQDGAMSVNGVRVEEPYRHPGDSASDVAFDVVVPAGRVWVMGDHRSESADSRAHLGDPGGGMVPLSDVIGRALAVYWPIGNAGGIGRPSQLSGIPAGGDGR